MPGLVDGFMSQLGTEGTAQLAKAIGADNQTVASAISMALPAMLAGMAQNASSPQGATSLANALDEHPPSVLGQLASVLTSGGGDGAKILGHVLGSKQNTVEQDMAAKGGIPIDLIMKLLPLLAPLVMSYLSKQKQQNGLDATTIPGAIGDELQRETAANPSLGDALGTVFGSLSKILGN